MERIHKSTPVHIGDFVFFRDKHGHSLGEVKAIAKEKTSIVLKLQIVKTTRPRDQHITRYAFKTIVTNYTRITYGSKKRKAWVLGQNEKIAHLL